MTEHEPSLGQLSRLALPEGSFMVMGSGILEALEIRMADDIDLVVRTDTYEHLISQGWTARVASNGAIGLESGIFQAYDAWNDEGIVKNVDKLFVDAEWVHGVPFNSLAKLSLYKKRRKRDKDIADLQLIERYLNMMNVLEYPTPQQSRERNVNQAKGWWRHLSDDAYSWSAVRSTSGGICS